MGNKIIIEKHRANTEFILDFIPFFNHFYSNFSQKAASLINSKRNRNITRICLKHCNLNEAGRICFAPFRQNESKNQFSYVISVRDMRYYICVQLFTQKRNSSWKVDGKQEKYIAGTFKNLLKYPLFVVFAALRAMAPWKHFKMKNTMTTKKLKVKKRGRSLAIIPCIVIKLTLRLICKGWYRLKA